MGGGGGGGGWGYFPGTLPVDRTLFGGVTTLTGLWAVSGGGLF